MNVFERALVLAPHADDGEFGCGATMSRILQGDTEVYYVAFSTAVKSLPAGFPEDALRNELDAATRSLGIESSRVQAYGFEVRTFPTHRQDILEILIQLRDRIDPDLVLLPSVHDIHQDHGTVAQEGLRAFKRATVMGYELPWNNYTFDHQVYVPVEEKHVAAKAAALRCYESQQHRNYANEDYIWSLAKTRGIDVNCAYAEAFELYRWIW